MQTSETIAIEPKSTMTDPLAVAQTILAGFNRHYSLFRYSAQRAKSLFEAGDWLGMQTLSRERIEYYDRRVRDCLRTMAPVIQTHVQSGPNAPSQRQQIFWQAVRQSFVSLLAEHHQPECAETFFNSVICRALHRDYFQNNFLFVRPAVATDYLDSNQPAYRVYYPAQTGLRQSLTRVLADFGMACGFDDLPRDVQRLARAGVREFNQRVSRDSSRRLAHDCQVHVLGNLFFRHQMAYVVGRVINEGTVYPFVVAMVRNISGRLKVDALLTCERELSAVFSFTRAYFLVDMQTPAAYVNFIASLLPRKTKAEIYTLLGLQKQGKTLFYRDFLQHLAHSHDQFELAPGIEGLVMSVFTLPSYPYVFKLIKDRIAKDAMTADIVRSKYQMVKLHDRVGRMADTWEYSQVALPKARFSESLLRQLQQVVGEQIHQDGEQLIFKHLYIERRMTPLNIYLGHAPAPLRRQAIIDYGYAIKELASANIFPGDMLYKNFGVTRFGRVVFYDYDEIQTLREMNFRRIPEAPDAQAEMASEPWYAVGPNDVFPEEFATFLLGRDEIRSVFLEHHADLLTPQWWAQCRAQVARGVFIDPKPYEAQPQFEC